MSGRSRGPLRAWILALGWAAFAVWSAVAEAGMHGRTLDPLPPSGTTPFLPPAASGLAERAWTVRVVEARFVPDEVVVGERPRILVRLENPAPRRSPAFLLRLERDGRPLLRLTRPAGLRLAAGSVRELRRRLPARETRRPGRLCYRLSAEAQGADPVLLAGAPEQLCLRVRARSQGPVAGSGAEPFGRRPPAADKGLAERFAERTAARSMKELEALGVLPKPERPAAPDVPKPGRRGPASPMPPLASGDPTDRLQDMVPRRARPRVPIRDWTGVPRPFAAGGGGGAVGSSGIPALRGRGSWRAVDRTGAEMWRGAHEPSGRDIVNEQFKRDVEALRDLAEDTRRIQDRERRRGVVSEQFGENQSIRYRDDGSVEVVDHETGITERRYPDGTREETYPDGTRVIYQPNGNTIVRAPDGSTTIFYPDGSRLDTSPDGESYYTSADGEVTQIARRREEDSDGQQEDRADSGSDDEDSSGEEDADEEEDGDEDDSSEGEDQEGAEAGREQAGYRPECENDPAASTPRGGRCPLEESGPSEGQKAKLTGEWVVNPDPRATGGVRWWPDGSPDPLCDRRAEEPGPEGEGRCPLDAVGPPRSLADVIEGATGPVTQPAPTP